MVQDAFSRPHLEHGHDDEDQDGEELVIADSGPALEAEAIAVLLK
jgi:hypothetical protein